jgi:ADP-heptose:LPS heptosyltransferase
VLQLGARFTAGLRTPDAPPLDAWVPYIYDQHETLRSLEVVGLVGATTDKLEPTVIVTPSDRAAAASFLAPVRRPFAVLHPGASDPRRRWPPTSFAAVGDALAAAALDVVVIGGVGEQDLAATVVAAMQAPAHNLAESLSLAALAGLLAAAQVMVANDSGPRHLAAAVGVPTVGIFWCGNLLNYGPLTRTFHRPVVSWRLHCPVCGLDCTRGRCDHQASFVADVTAEDVCATVDDVLSTIGRMGRTPREA